MEQAIKDPALKKPTPASTGLFKGNSSLQLFFIEALKDIYWAEKELVRSIPNLVKAASNAELVNAFNEHLAQTRTHTRRLEEVFQLLGKTGEAKTCFVMEGLVKEAGSIIDETAEGSSARDAGLIMAAQKVEHYEIATYGSLVEYAKTLGYNDIHGILQLTLDEERMADQGLTLIAQNKINWEADTEKKIGKNPV